MPHEARRQTGARAIETLSVEDLRLECTRLRTLVGQLESALRSRIVVEQAKGVLAERLQLRADDAFQLLRLAARSERMKVQLLAREIVDKPETPAAIVRASARESRWRAASLRERNDAIQEQHLRLRARYEQQRERLEAKPPAGHSRSA